MRTKPTTFFAVLSALAMVASAAEDTATTTHLPAPPSEESSGIEVEWAAGYDTHYIFRGELLKRDTPWTHLKIILPLNDTLSLELLPWYLHSLDGDYTEFDLNANLSASLGEWEVGLGYAGYYYPKGSLGNGEGIDDEQEIALSISRDVGPLSVGLQNVYSITRHGWYFDLSVELPYEVNDTLTLTPCVLVGWDTDYFGPGTGLNHVLLQLSADYALTENVTLSAYLAGNLPIDQLDYVEDDIFGGVKIAVRF